MLSYIGLHTHIVEAVRLHMYRPTLEHKEPIKEPEATKHNIHISTGVKLLCKAIWVYDNVLTHSIQSATKQS